MNNEHKTQCVTSDVVFHKTVYKHIYTLLIRLSVRIDQFLYINVNFLEFHHRLRCQLARTYVNICIHVCINTPSEIHTHAGARTGT